MNQGATSGTFPESLPVPSFWYPFLLLVLCMHLLSSSTKFDARSHSLLPSSNQDDYDLSDISVYQWCRNTTPYNLIYDGTASYPYLPLPNSLDQTIDVVGTKPGVLESIGIETGGKNYQIGDEVLFNNDNTKGFDAAAKVSRILGKPVSSVSAATSLSLIHI